jgi:hypothetical protein
MIKVKVERDHDNEFGDRRAKTKGGSYDAPALAAQSLKANRFVSYADSKAAGVALREAGLPAEGDAPDEPARG